MRKDINPPSEIGGDKAPIPIPSVEDSWAQMKNALDARLPVVRRPWHGLHGVHMFWAAAAAAAVIGVTAVFVVRGVRHRGVSGGYVVRDGRKGGDGQVGTGGERGLGASGGGDSAVAEARGLGVSGRGNSAVAGGQAGAGQGNRPDASGRSNSAGVNGGQGGGQKEGEEAGNSNDAAANTAGHSRNGGSTGINGSSAIGRLRQTGGRNGEEHGTGASGGGNSPGANRDQGRDDVSVAGVDASHSGSNGRRTTSAGSNGSRGHDASSASSASAASSDRATGRGQTRLHSMPLAGTGADLSRTLFVKADSMIRRKADRHGGLRDAVIAGQTLKKPHRPQERWMAAGLGLDKSFPIGGQEMSAYSINGHAKNFNDISPSAYLQYYLNDDLMLRARITPYKSQYIKSSSIDSAYDSTYAPPPNYAPFQVVVLKKLFYADLTLTIHQRIWRGLWLGAGVDYSRLTGGAAIQNVIMVPLSGQTPDTIYRSETAGITGAGYAKISKSDWRGILEVDYVWRRLRVGVNYQQAFTSYLPALADGSKSNNKNTSLSIHLSYDLWEPKRH